MKRKLSPRAREALIALKTEGQVLDLTSSNIEVAFAETSHQLRLFGDAMKTANAVSGGKLFAAMRDEA